MMRVLIVDDHPFLRAGIRSVLVESEFNVVAEAADGEQAFAAIATHDPDIVLLDVSMPPPDGIATLERLRGLGDQRPVVLLTAAIGDGQLLRAVKCGVNGIVMKDGAEETLIDSLREVAACRTAVPRQLLERALALSLDEGGEYNPLAKLNAKERQIARSVGEGMRNRAIAVVMGMSEGSVKVYLHRIYNKLGISTRTELALVIRDCETNV